MFARRPTLVPSTEQPPQPDTGWRRARVAPSLAEVYRSVPVGGL